MAVVRPSIENSVDLRPETGARLQAADFGSAGERIGAAAERLGRAGQQFVSDQQEIQLVHAEAAARKTRNEALVRVAEIRGRVSQASLLDAETERQKAEEEIKALKTEMSSSLGSPVAQRMFTDSFDVSVTDDLIAMRLHADKETKTARVEGAKSSIRVFSDRAIEGLDEINVENPNVQTVFQNIDIIHAGAPQAVRDELRAEVISDIHAGRVTRLLTSEDDDAPIKAMEYLRRHAGEISPKAEAELATRLRAPFEEAELDAAEGVIDAYIGTGKLPDGSTVDETIGAAPEAPEPEDAPVPVVGNIVRGRDYNPAGERGRRGQGPAEHAARGSHNKGRDFPAPAGTPILPPMSGKVVDVGGGPGNPNGHFIKVRFDNGKTGIYLHMRSRSPLRPGDSVEASTILGAVGNTGARKGGTSGGNHVHFSVLDEKGSFVDPDTVMWNNRVNLPAYKAAQRDGEDLYRVAHAVAVKQNLSRGQYNALLRRVDLRVGRERGLREDNFQQQHEQAMEAVASLGDGLVRRDQIKNYSLLKPEHRITIDNIIERNTRPVEPEADSAVYLDALELSYEDPAAFLRINPRALNITRGQQAEFIRLQGTLGKKREGELDPKPNDTAASYTRINTAMARYLPGDAKNATLRLERNKVRSQVVRLVEQQQAKEKRQLTDAEIDALVSERVTNVTVTYRKPGRIWGESTETETLPRYKAEELKRSGSLIGARVERRTAVIEAYRRAYNGRTPSDAEIDEILREGGF